MRRDPDQNSYGQLIELILTNLLRAGVAAASHTATARAFTVRVAEVKGLVRLTLN